MADAAFSMNTMQKTLENRENQLIIIHSSFTTHRVILLHTLSVKYYNDLLSRQNSERGRDEVTFFYVGDLFCIHLDTI